jgi:hypothetical protein
MLVRAFGYAGTGTLVTCTCRPHTHTYTKYNALALLSSLSLLFSNPNSNLCLPTRLTPVFYERIASHTTHGLSCLGFVVSNTTTTWIAKEPTRRLRHQSLATLADLLLHVSTIVLKVSGAISMATVILFFGIGGKSK